MITMFRLSSMVWALAAFTASFASAGDVILCVITNFNTPVMEFRTEIIPEAEYNGKMEDGALLGECSEFLGQLCDDGDFCTIDYDFETTACLPLPREVVADCAMT